MMAKEQDKFRVLAEGLIASGIDLLDEDVDSKYINKFSRELAKNSNLANKMLFRYVLAFRLMGISRTELSKPDLTKDELMRFYGREPFITLIPKILKKGVSVGDLGRLLRTSERWGSYSALFDTIEVLEAFDYQLDRLLSILDLEKIDDAEIFNSRIGLAQFDDKGNFVKEIEVSHEEIGPDSFFEEY